MRGPHLFVRRENCPACLSGDVVTLYESPFDRNPIAGFIRDYYGVDPSLLSGAPYQLLRCTRCTLLFQGWVGDEHLLRDLYGGWINESNLPAEDPLYQAVMAHPLESRDAHEIIAASAFLGIAPAEMTTLDYGMGWAMWARIARHLGCRSFGTELSPDRATFAREHGITVAEEEDIGAQQFDFINTEQVMEHIPALRPTLDRLASALRPGGILKISVPSAENAAAVIEALSRTGALPAFDDFMPVQPLEHVNSFTREALRRLAAALGLHVASPSLGHRYAFLKMAGTVSLRRPKNFAKEMVRPLYQAVNRRNLYVWLRKPC